MTLRPGLARTPGSWKGPRRNLGLADDGRGGDAEGAAPGEASSPSAQDPAGPGPEWKAALLSFVKGSHRSAGLLGVLLSLCLFSPAAKNSGIGATGPGPNSSPAALVG